MTVKTEISLTDTFPKKNKAKKSKINFNFSAKLLLSVYFYRQQTSFHFSSSCIFTFRLFFIFLTTHFTLIQPLIPKFEDQDEPPY